MTVLSQRPLGNSGLEVSCLGLGTVKFGRNQQVKYPHPFRLPDDRQLRELLALARDLGINLLDTAPAYGNSEQRIGKLLTAREHWILCSKVGEEFVAGKSVYRFRGDYLQQRVERSLRDLQTDYLDLVLIHSDGNDLQILHHTDCVESLHRLKENGLVRSIGMSSKTVEGGIHSLQLLDVAMVTYNRSATAEAAVIDFAAAHNKGILIKKALHSGHFSTGENAAPAAAGTAGKALHFALSRPGVSSVVIGTINPAHLRANVQAAVAVTGPANR